MPELRGLSIEVAKGTFNNSFLPTELEVVREKSGGDVPIGQVTSQVPKAGTVVNPGDEVHVTVAGGYFAPATPKLRIVNMRSQSVSIKGASHVLLTIPSRAARTLERAAACKAGPLLALGANGAQLETFANACDGRAWIINDQS
jgi:hypothetical protein